MHVMTKVFISYAREDALFAERIARDLLRSNQTVWFDKYDLAPGQDWRSAITDAIENSDVFIAILSSTSVDKKGFVQKELRIALEIVDLLPEGRIFIIPIRIEACSVPSRRLRALHYIDMFPEENYRSGVSKIIQVLDPGRRQYRDAPADVDKVAVSDMLRSYGFFEKDMNPGGFGIEHSFERVDLGIGMGVLDRATGLMWEQLGSEAIRFKDAQDRIETLNSKKCGGFDNWRLPTLEEAAGLMEKSISLRTYPGRTQLHLHSFFNGGMEIVWTADFNTALTYAGEAYLAGLRSDNSNSPLTSLVGNWVVSYKDGICRLVSPPREDVSLEQLKAYGPLSGSGLHGSISCFGVRHV